MQSRLYLTLIDRSRRGRPTQYLPRQRQEDPDRIDRPSSSLPSMHARAPALSVCCLRGEPTAQGRGSGDPDGLAALRLMRRSDPLRLSAPWNGSRSSLRGRAGPISQVPPPPRLEPSHCSADPMPNTGRLGIITQKQQPPKFVVLFRPSATIRHPVGGAEQSVSTIDTRQGTTTLPVLVPKVVPSMHARYTHTPIGDASTHLSSFCNPDPTHHDPRRSRSGHYKINSTMLRPMREQSNADILAIS